MTTDREASSTVRELAAAAFRYFTDSAYKFVEPDEDAKALYAKRRNDFKALGWLDLPSEEEFGGPGAPLLAIHVMRAAGRCLAAGPLVDDIAVAPALRTLLADGPSIDEVIVLVDESRPGGEPDLQPALSGSVLTGAVRAAPHVVCADRLLVVAACDGAEFLVSVPPARQGVSLLPLTSLDPCTTAAEIRFDVQITSNDILMQPPKAGAVVSSMREQAQLAVSAELWGVAEELLRMSVEHALSRRQFGRPIGAFQAVKHMLAQMACEVAALGNLVLATAERMPGHPKDRRLSCAALKAYASTVTRAAAETALQVHGGIGFTAEHALQRYYKHALMLEPRYGAPTDLHVLVGTMRVASEERSARNQSAQFSALAEEH